MPEGIPEDDSVIAEPEDSSTHRVSDEDVRSIIDIDDSIATLQPFISVANMLVTEKLTGYFEDSRLKEIERWLSAHFIAIRDPRIVRESIDNTSQAYFVQNKSKNVVGLDTTPYGKQVLILDTTGRLSELGLRTAVFSAMGPTSEEE